MLMLRLSIHEIRPTRRYRQKALVHRIAKGEFSASDEQYVMHTRRIAYASTILARSKLH